MPFDWKGLRSMSRGPRQIKDRRNLVGQVGFGPGPKNLIAAANIEPPFFHGQQWAFHLQLNCISV